MSHPFIHTSLPLLRALQVDQSQADYVEMVKAGGHSGTLRRDDSTCILLTRQCHPAVGLCPICPAPSLTRSHPSLHPNPPHPALPRAHLNPTPPTPHPALRSSCPALAQTHPFRTLPLPRFALRQSHPRPSLYSTVMPLPLSRDHGVLGRAQSDSEAASRHSKADSQGCMIRTMQREQ